MLVLVACWLPSQNDSANDDGGKNSTISQVTEDHHSPYRSIDSSMESETMSSQLSHFVVGAVSRGWYRMEPEAGI